MSRFCVGTGSHLTRTGSPIASAPLTMSGWVYGSTGALILGLKVAGSSNNRFELGFNSGIVIAVARDGTTNGASNAVGKNMKAYPTHCAGVWTSTTLRQAFNNGVAAATNTTSVSPAGMNEINIGVGTVVTSTGGHLEMVGLWNVALGLDEIALLASGVSPLLVRRTALVGFWPLLGNNSPEPDLARGLYPITPTATCMPGPPIPFARRVSV